MTCIVGLVKEGDVYIGGDSQGTDGRRLLQCVRADQKVFRKKDMIFGFTSSYRMGQLLRYKLSFPRPHEGQDLYEFMVTDFVDEVRTCLKDGGYASKNNEVEEGGTFLVGYRGRLFTIGDDYQVAESHWPFDAVGCGDQLALGALFALTDGGDAGTQPPDDPIRAIAVAIRAASEFSAGVGGPIHIEHLLSGDREGAA